MAIPDSSLEAALRALGEPAEHPSREQLSAYCRGELSGEESAAIAAHLAWCREDADFVLALREIAELDPAEKAPAETLDAAWRDFQQRRGGPAVPVPFPVASARGGSPRWRTTTALAASLLLAVVSGAVVGSLVRFPGAGKPMPNGLIVDLGAAEEARAAGPRSQEIRLAPEDTSLTLILHPTRPLESASYSLSLLGRRGKPIWQGEVRPRELETFSVTFPRDFLSAGQYVLELRGWKHGRAAVLDRFPVRLRFGTSGDSAAPP